MSSSHKTKSYIPGNVLAPQPEFEVKFNCKVRYFPDNQIKISCFSRPVYNPNKAEERKAKKPQESLQEYDPETGTMSYKYVEGKTLFDPFTGKYEPFTIYKEPKGPRMDNIKRAIDKAFEIGLSNEFHYFVTLTLDQTKINRYDPDTIYPKLKVWLSNCVSRNKMDYILFPEYHEQKPGEDRPAIHFHALVNAKDFQLADSGRKTEAGQTIYNLNNWKFGFSTVIELDGRTAIVRYVTKYITKGNARIFGKFYLSGGKTLKREVPAEYLNVDYASFEGEEYEIPAAHMRVKYKTFNLGESNDSINDKDLEGDYVPG